MAEVLLRWGDPIFENAPEFDFHNQSAEAQLKQFGYNNDFVGYLPLTSKFGQDARALLCVNHEYPINGLMVPDLENEARESITEEQLNIAMASVGNTIVEIVMTDGKWSINKASKYNRRITPLDTIIEMSGPVAGHPRLQTKADPGGKTVLGLSLIHI